jgi:hypothetical protein
VGLINQAPAKDESAYEIAKKNWGLKMGLAPFL